MTRTLIIALALSGLACGTSASSENAPAQIQWETSEATAFARAAKEGRGVLVDVRSTWCEPCEQLDAKTFTDREVIRFVNRHYVALKLDVSEQTEADDAIQERYQARLLPAVLFMNKDRKVRARIDEFVPPEAFLAVAAKSVDR